MCIRDSPPQGQIVDTPTGSGPEMNVIRDQSHQSCALNDYLEFVTVRVTSIIIYIVCVCTCLKPRSAARWQKLTLYKPERTHKKHIRELL